MFPMRFVTMEPVLNYLRYSNAWSCRPTEDAQGERNVVEVLDTEWRVRYWDDSDGAIVLTPQSWLTLVTVCRDALSGGNPDLISQRNAPIFQETLANLLEIELTVRVLEASEE